MRILSHLALLLHTASAARTSRRSVLDDSMLLQDAAATVEMAPQPAAGHPYGFPGG